MRRKSASSARSFAAGLAPSTPELTIYDAPPAVLEARHRVKELLKLELPADVQQLAAGALEYLNVAVRAMALEDMEVLLRSPMEEFPEESVAAVV